MKNNGPVTEIIVEAYKKVGYVVQVSFFPWQRGELYARVGKYDGMFPPWHTKERETYFVFSDPLFPNEIGFYKRKEMNITFKKYEDLKEYDIGICRGYANPDGFDAAGLKTQEVASDVINLKKLAHGRIDLALIDKKLARFFIRTELPQYSDDLEWIEPSLEFKMQYLCVSRRTLDWQKKLDDFNRGLKLLRESGEFEKIILKHDL